MASYYGAPVDSDSKSFGERLRDYYSDSDFVRIQNIDTKSVSYQFQTVENEVFTQPAPHLGETYHKNPPQVVTLQPGQTKLCPAAEADAFMTTLIKQITSRKTHDDIEKGIVAPWQSSNWSDPATQKRIIEQALVGKEDLIGQYNASLNKPSEVAKDLEFDDTSVINEPVRRGRPKAV